MNKFFVQLALISSLFIAGISHAWTIEEFDIEANILADGTVNITESIKADFTGAPPKRGIFRDIPVQYRDENEALFNTPITDVKVVDQDGLNRMFAQSKNGSNLSLKIGNPNVYVDPKETYVISYNIAGVLNAFEAYDEFYWNVTGNEWEAPIQKATALVTLPTKSEFLKAKCLTGIIDSSDENCEFQVNEEAFAAGFKTTQPLTLGEGLTIVFGWEKDLVAIPERQMSFDFEAWAKKFQYLFLLFPVWGVARNLRIRNALKPKKTVIPLYHPPENLGVGLIGYFDRGKPHTRDLTALLTQLCVKGLLKIKETSPAGAFKSASYEFTALPRADVKLDKEEQFVYDHIVVAPGETLSLKKLVKKNKSIFKHANYQRLLNQIRLEVSHYFRFQLGSTQGFLKVMGLIFGGFFVFFLGFAFSLMAKSLLPAAALIIGTIAALSLPQFGKKGQLIQHDIKGYKMFLSTADKDRINWSEAQNIFEENLPYAIALNLTDKWAKVFGDKIQLPEWYEGQNISNIRSLEKGITATAARSITSSAPRSTASSRRSSGFSRGGGRSGGGFGGGGGGSW